MTPHNPCRPLLTAFFLLIGLTLFAEGPSAITGAFERSGNFSRFNPVFPAALARIPEAQAETVVPASVPTEEESRDREFNQNRLQSMLLNNDIFALYGKPDGRNMGILGQYPISQIEAVMNSHIPQWDSANGQRGVIPAFYMIYGTCWPEGEIGILRDSLTREYIEFAAQRGWLVFLDHQIGKYTVEAAMAKLLPYLRYPNVHLALDPEWRTTRPMQEIGFVTAAELNTAQQMMQDYLIEHNLPGRRMLVVHQFKPKMIANRPAVRSDYELVKLIHCADGFGAPPLKKSAYAFNAAATNIPLKSFKLFLKPTIAGAGWDEPLMTAAEVFALEPRPYLIMIQ